MGTPKRILCVCEDPDLLKTRLLVLESAGFTVLGASPSEAIATIKVTFPDTVLISNRIDPESRAAIRAAADRARIIELPLWVYPHDLAALVQSGAD